MTTSDLMTRATAALERGDWGTALDLVDEALLSDDVIDRAAALELRAMAAYGSGELEEAIGSFEHVHALQIERDDPAEAARAAAMIAMYLMMDTGLMSPVRGWLATADRLLDGIDVCPAHAVVAMTRTYERFMCGDLDAARAQSAAAIDLGERTAVPAAVVIGRTAQARVRIFDGDLDGGLAQLDEVGALLMSGAVDPLTTGMMFCEIICAAQGLAMYEMASEWTEVMERWCHGAAIGGINGRCRVHRAEILRVSGTSEEAEAEALGACDELRPWMRREFGWPLVELGTIRLRRGDFAGAEDAFLEAHQHAWSPQPGLALLRLQQGDSDEAARMIAEAIEHPFDIPSKERPPFGELRHAPLLDAQIEIAAVRGDLATAQAATARLGAIAERYPGPFLRASARLAAARCALMAGDVAAAVQAAGAAVALWADAGAPYEAACARLTLGDAHDAADRPEAAVMERRAAESGFAQYGARRQARRAAELAGETGPVGAVGAVGAVGRHDPAGQVVRFGLEGDHRVVAYDGTTTTLRDLKGLRYVARLLADPGREIHVLDLVGAEEGVIRPIGAHHGLDAVRGAEAGLPVLDDSAREAYRRRLAEIESDIDDARRMNDPARADLAERDREYLIAELRRAVGLGGRHRTVGGSAERARTAVARSIKYALDRLAEHQPILATRLRACVRTGVYCVYEPDLVAPLAWDLTAR